MPEPRSFVPSIVSLLVVVLTGGGTDDLENQARELGVNEFLRKGLSLNVLVRAIGKAMQQPPPS